MTGPTAPPPPVAGEAEPVALRRARRLLLQLRPHHPAQFVVVGFAVAVLGTTGLLALPGATEEGQGAPWLVALFTATSAVCVTGLVVVDTPTYWSGFGEGVILAGIQLGGLGIMTGASLLGVLVSRRLGLRSRLTAQAETKALQLGDVTRVVRGVALMSLAFESVVALVLTLRFWAAYDVPLGRAVYEGVFTAVSSFNNAGFGLRSDNLVGFVTDPVVCVPVGLAVIAGGLGFPVLFELRRELFAPRLWSLHTKVTLLTTALLLAGGSVAMTAFEWTNPRTLGPLDVPGKLLAGTFQAIQPRTAGFNSVDVAGMNETTWLVSDVLMFIGGGSASTAGGIKVTTFMVLFFAIVAEARGDADVDAFHRRIAAAVLRQAVSVALLAVALVVSGTLLLLALSGLDLDRVLYETVSAVSTVGLSTGITADLPASAQLVLVGLMFLGRTGTITLASALALRERTRLYRYPEERPIVG